MAWPRFTPSKAAQPLPGWRLLQGNSVDRKYAQRVRWSRLPPMVAMLRSCCDAAFHSASDSAGYCAFTSGSSATSLMRASAPNTSSSGPDASNAASSPMPVMSIRWSGASTFSFMRSTSVVPPARMRGSRPGAAAMIASASFTDRGRA
jgi:hypothetical protein